VLDYQQRLPTSHFYQLNEIMELIFYLKPKKILDIGTGFGKYGFLSREYLDIWGRQNHDFNEHYCIIDGIEVFEKYITPVHDYIYDNIYIGNAKDLLPTLDKKYDLILLIDVLEHFDYDGGLKILSECKKVGRNIIISTPKDIGNQKGSRGNVFETHKFQWKKKHFEMYKKKFFVSNNKSLIYFIGEDAYKVRNNIKTSKSKIKAKFKQYFPSIYKLLGKN